MKEFYKRRLKKEEMMIGDAFSEILGDKILNIINLNLIFMTFEDVELFHVFFYLLLLLLLFLFIYCIIFIFFLIEILVWMLVQIVERKKFFEKGGKYFKFKRKMWYF